MKARLSDTVGERKGQKEAEDKREGEKRKTAVILGHLCHCWGDCNAKSRHPSTL